MCILWHLLVGGELEGMYVSIKIEKRGIREEGVAGFDGWS